MGVYPFAVSDPDFFGLEGLVERVFLVEFDLIF